MGEKKTIDKYAAWLVSEWSERNGDMRPSDVTIGSHKKAWWIGSCGHEWEAIIKNRVNGSGCPYCSGNAVLPGFNDVATVAPWIVSEWSDKNGELRPTDMTSQANRKVWWKGACGHEWQSRIADRVKKRCGCPYCTNERVERGINDLTVLMPELAEELVEESLMEQNSDTNEEDPKDGKLPVHTINSHKMVRWRCKKCGFEWDAQIYTRVRGGAGCPACRREKNWENLKRKAESDREKIRFIRALPWVTIRYYLQSVGEAFIPDCGSAIGIPLDFYLPERNGAIIIANPLPHAKRQDVIATVCRKARIRLLYIVPGGERMYNNCHCITMVEESPEAWNEAIQAALDLFGIEVDIDIRGDKSGIYDLYCEGAA